MSRFSFHWNLKTDLTGRRRNCLSFFFASFFFFRDFLTLISTLFGHPVLIFYGADYRLRIRQVILRGLLCRKHCSSFVCSIPEFYLHILVFARRYRKPIQLNDFFPRVRVFCIVTITGLASNKSSLCDCCRRERCFRHSNSHAVTYVLTEKQRKYR